MKKQILVGITAVAMTATVATAFIPAIGNSVFALNQSSDYTTQFYCRTVIEDEVQYLTYKGGDKLEKTDNEAEALFEINFTSNSTVTINRGDYHLGYEGTSKTNLKNTASTWDLSAGLLKQHEGTRTLLFSVSNDYARAYANAISESYLPVYFYTDAELSLITDGCRAIWDENREERLQNLSYNIVEPTPAVKYDVTLNANGGSGTKTIQVKEGSYTLPDGEGFSRSGYDFVGWSYTSDGQKIEETSITISSNIILYAVWTEHQGGQEVTVSLTQNELKASSQTITKGEITLTNSSTYTGAVTELRIYKNNTLTISSEKTITKIEFTCTASGTTKYGPGCFAALSGYSYSGTKGTWTGSSSEIEFTAESNQVRITEMTITYID